MISPNTDGTLCVATAPKVFGDEEPTMSAEREKQAAAEAAAELVENGMTVGLGTGSTVAFLLPALARRKIDIRCVATSPRT
jgi:ribose 5-phosphate isomerase A